MTANDLLQEIRQIYDNQKEKFYRIKGILEAEIAKKTVEQGTVKIDLQQKVENLERGKIIRVDVYVKNLLTDDIEVFRLIPDGFCGIGITITPGNEEKISLEGPEVALVVRPPWGLDTRTCMLNVTSNKDILTWSTEDDRWSIRIASNDVHSEVPTTVGVEVSVEMSTL